jgi:acetyl esterase/lipase
MFNVPPLVARGLHHVRNHHCWTSLIDPRAADPTPEPLWAKGAPGVVAGDKDRPNLTAYLPAKEKANGCAVVVCPGGGYGFLADNREGRDVSKWLNERGVAAFILRYRIVQKDRPGPLHPYPLMDAQRAIRYVRANAEKYGVDPKRVGIWGFSADGHLASTAVTHSDTGKVDSKDPIEGFSSRATSSRSFPWDTKKS